MAASLFDLFSIGVGPSSSHTVGPMRAVAAFAATLRREGLIPRIGDLDITVYGSLPRPAKGTEPSPPSWSALRDRNRAPSRPTREAVLDRQRRTGQVLLAGQRSVRLCEADLVRRPAETLDSHPNGTQFTALADGNALLQRTYYSVAVASSLPKANTPPLATTKRPLHTPSPPRHNCSNSPNNARCPLAASCWPTNAGCGPLPTSPKTCCTFATSCKTAPLAACSSPACCPGPEGSPPRPRLAPAPCRRDPAMDPRFAEDWVNLFALSVNEENASGGRVVTAPTNGAAGIIPAVLHFAENFTPAGAENPDDTAVRFLLTAGAIGSLYKEQPPFPAPKWVARARSALRLRWPRVRCRNPGGTPQQAENAAEIAMEHCLGLPAIRSGDLSRFRASSAMPSQRIKRSLPPGWPCAATASTGYPGRSHRDDAGHRTRHELQLQKRHWAAWR